MRDKKTMYKWGFSGSMWFNLGTSIYIIGLKLLKKILYKDINDINMS